MTCLQHRYGHGYELYAVATSPNGRLIASTCKVIIFTVHMLHIECFRRPIQASKQEHACIRVWDTTSWRQVASLTFHTLTVTQLAFSHSGSFLLAVSRDRSWSLWQQQMGPEGVCACACISVLIFCCLYWSIVSFVLVGKMEKSSNAHSRIIWSCSWSHDDCCFATASRDKKVDKLLFS